MESFPNQNEYESDIENVDFYCDTKEIVESVNTWVADKTKGMIPKILPKGCLDKDTILVLLNAVYFKGEQPE